MANGEIVGTRALIAHFKKIRLALPGTLNDPGLQQVLVRRFRKRFDERRSPDGNYWKPLAEVTVLRKKRAGYSYPDRPLYATGSLRKSINVVRGVTTGLIVTNTGFGFRLGVTNIKQARYGFYHQHGVGVPERRFIGLSNEDIDVVVSYVGKKLYRTLSV